ncbi:MAG: Hpt domain-containing protein [Bacilli bacterium]|nr:Hpt domain-containing protein [Bacilli bacterium]
MTIEQLYIAIEECYEDMLNRFASPERITKYVKMFSADDSFSQLESALSEKNYELAFRMVHTLKGVSANLGFMKLFDKSVVLTELLRAKQYDADLLTPFNNIKTEYKKIVELIPQLS